MPTRTYDLADLRGAGSEQLRRRFAQGDEVLVLTGAGCSADSGLPVFTGPTGVYADEELRALSHADRLPEALPALWQAWGPRRTRFAAAEPHAGHRALAAWADRRTAQGASVALATQNVDDLHERAGSRSVAHLHGRLDRTTCTACAYVREPDPVAHTAPPACPRCAAPLRLGVTLFGERPDLDAEHATRRAVRVCRTYLAVGTSSVVSTSTGLLRHAGDVGALTVALDPRPDVDERYDVHVRATAVEALPLLLGG